MTLTLFRYFFYFNPRPPRGGRLLCFCQRAGHARISIHALREEGDGYGNVLSISRSGFQSTPSARRATVRSVGGPTRGIISIHALREEGDDFFGVDALFFFAFQSTPSARRATTSETSALSLLKYFNPRPPRGGRLKVYCCVSAPKKHFNPRPPRGGRLVLKSPVVLSVLFQSTPSARRATTITQWTT